MRDQLERCRRHRRVAARPAGSAERRAAAGVRAPRLSTASRRFSRRVAGPARGATGPERAWTSSRRACTPRRGSSARGRSAHTGISLGRSAHPVGPRPWAGAGFEPVPDRRAVPPCALIDGRAARLLGTRRDRDEAADAGDRARARFHPADAFRLIITFFREPRGRYHSTFTRPDGAVLKLQGGSYNKLGGGVRVPHDIAHLLSNRPSACDRGLWGTLAAGGLVMNPSSSAGRSLRTPRRRPGRSARRGRRVAAAGRGGRARRRGRGVDRDARWRRRGSAGRCRSRASARARGAQLRNSAARWDQVPEGGTLAMTWSSRAS